MKNLFQSILQTRMANVPGPPSAVPVYRGQDVGIISYVRYGLIAVALLNLVIKVLDVPKDEVNPIQDPESSLKIEKSTTSQRLANYILNSMVEMKGMSKEDLSKTKERIGYERNLELSPFENDIFILHQVPTLNRTNITSTTYINGSIPQNITEEVPSRESIVYSNSQLPAQLLSPAWNITDLVDLEYYLNTNETFDRKDYYLQKDSTWMGAWEHVDLNIQQTLTDYFQYTLPENFYNGSIYLHMYISKSNCDPGKELNEDVCSLYGKKTITLTCYLPKINSAKSGLPTSEPENLQYVENEDRAELDYPVMSYWNPNITLYLEKPIGHVAVSSLPQDLLDTTCIDESGKRDETTGVIQRYFSFLFYNRFWQMESDMLELNSTVNTLTVNLQLEVSPFWKFQFFVSTSDNVKQQAKLDGLRNPEPLTFALDPVKRIVLETSTWLLLILAPAGVLSPILVALALKNDVQHWRNRKDRVGISISSIVCNISTQMITSSVLIDAYEGLAYIIYALQVFGILLGAWKIIALLKWQGLDVVTPVPAVEGISTTTVKLFGGKKLVISDKRPLNKSEQKSKEYDSKAFRVLSRVCIPLMLGYVGYSLRYKEFESWYCFITTTLFGFVYRYQFLALLPPAYVNYKLKSVAHMPKRVMVYRGLYALVNDSFALVVRASLICKLTALGDVVIFFIYLYQCWEYRVDYNRENEISDVTGEQDQQNKKNK